MNYAVKKLDLAYVKLLIDYNANINYPQGYLKWTPLMQAAHRGNVEILRLLLRNNADTTMQDSSNKTPLQIARYYKKTDTERILLEYELDSETADK